MAFLVLNVLQLCTLFGPLNIFLDRWFSLLKAFAQVMFRALYSLLIGMSQGPVLNPKL